MAGVEGTRARAEYVADVAWLVIALVLLALAAFFVVGGVYGLGLAGRQESVTLTECRRDNGRGGEKVECVGIPYESNASQESHASYAVKADRSDWNGDVVSVVELPWGTHQVVASRGASMWIGYVFLALFVLAGVGLPAWVVWWRFWRSPRHIRGAPDLGGR